MTRLYLLKNIKSKAPTSADVVANFAQFVHPSGGFRSRRYISTSRTQELFPTNFEARSTPGSTSRFVLLIEYVRQFTRALFVGRTRGTKTSLFPSVCIHSGQAYAGRCLEPLLFPRLFSIRNPVAIGISRSLGCDFAPWIQIGFASNLTTFRRARVVSPIRAPEPAGNSIWRDRRNCLPPFLANA